MLDTLDEFARLSRLGFAFNVLTRYSDADRRRPDLYYANPLALFLVQKPSAEHSRIVSEGLPYLGMAVEVISKVGVAIEVIIVVN